MYYSDKVLLIFQCNYTHIHSSKSTYLFEKIIPVVNLFKSTVRKRFIISSSVFLSYSGVGLIVFIF